MYVTSPPKAIINHSVTRDATSSIQHIFAFLSHELFPTARVNTKLYCATAYAYTLT